MQDALPEQPAEPRIPSEGKLVIHRDGVDVSFEYLLDPDSVPMIRASCPLPTSLGSDALPVLPAMSFRKETPADVRAKRWGLSSELQVDDPEFDERIYIECNASARAPKLILANPQVRGGIASLLAAGYDEFALRDHGYALVSTWLVDSRPFGPAQIEQTVAAFVEIVAGLPPFRTVPVERKIEHGAVVTMLAWGSALGALVLSTFAKQHWQPVGGGLFSLMVGVSVLLFLAHLAGLWVSLRGRFRARSWLIWAASSGLMLAPFGGRAAVMALNGGFDPSSVSYTLPLVDKRVESTEDSNTFYVQFADVPGATPARVEIEVERDLFVKAGPGVLYQLELGEGTLGTPWLRDLQLAPVEPALPTATPGGLVGSPQ